MAITTLGWVAVGMFGGLPFFCCGSLAPPVDCIFETISGFTTTGASVIRDVEIVAPGLLFWRSLTHWLGGHGHHSSWAWPFSPSWGWAACSSTRPKCPGPVVDKLKPRLKDTAMILWKVYVFFTVAETILLVLGGMDLFDSLCHTFGTLATGGFSTKNASIGYYHSVYIDVVVTIFMLLGGINFALHFQVFRGKPLAMWRDPEFRFFMGFLLLLTCIITLELLRARLMILWKVPPICLLSRWPPSHHHGLCHRRFRTCGRPLPQCLLLLCMLVGGLPSVPPAAQ